MFEFLKKLSHSGHKHLHGHRRGHTRQETAMRDDALSTSQCPLCDEHCPLSNPGCRKGVAFASQQFTAMKGDYNDN
jgi:hypothetical protein